jgi:hypothetical protein
MERLHITNDWAVDLQSPECELNFETCELICTHGVRVHGCAFHYSCKKCAHLFRRRVNEGFCEYTSMRCTSCKTGFTNNKKYYQIVPL